MGFGLVLVSVVGTANGYTHYNKLAIARNIFFVVIVYYKLCLRRCNVFRDVFAVGQQVWIEKRQSDVGRVRCLAVNILGSEINKS